ncbi:MAG: hypothetical protein IPN38_06385 [Flavobacteriales bacterium]|nr:hypothetical protein [Flavobacteriales bacterium]
MGIYRFRVLIDDSSEAFRDIEIRSSQTFFDLHKAIKKAFGFIGEEMACFYVSDAEWTKGTEIPLADMGFAEDGAMPLMMDQVQIGDHIRDTDQRFVYAYDFLYMWMFMLELVDAHDPIKGKRYPQVVLSHGTPPGEHSRELNLADGILPDEDDTYRADTEEVYDADEDMGFDEEEGDHHEEGGHGHEEGHDPSQEW